MKFSAKKIPVKISPCPISEAIFEMRFLSPLISEVIPGLLYQHIKDFLPKIERLPITDLPQEMREHAPDLKFSPHYAFSGNSFRLQIGPSSFSLISQREYAGWSVFYEKLNFILGVVKGINLVQKPLRTGLRYVNVFEDNNILNNLRIDFSIDSNNLFNSDTTLKTEFDYQQHKCIVQISNCLRNTLDPSRKASWIDIDIISDLSSSSQVFQNNDYLDIIGKSHEIEKLIFFSLLKEDYLKKNFNPQYK